MLRICSQRFLQSIRELGAIGATAAGGVTRLALTDTDWQAREWLRQKAVAYGLSAHMDPVGNLFIGLGDVRDSSPILVGSHVDTVMNGGRYDGALGVLAGLESLICLREAQLELQHPVQLVVWTEEEGSRFKGGLVGSRAFIGELPESELEDVDADGVTLAQALRNWGLEPGHLSQVARTPGQIQAYVELHIEQGGKLDAAQQHIGVVEGIVGIRRYDIVVEGEANHAGTTPMTMRKDALVAAAKMVQVTQKIARDNEYADAVATVGKLVVYPGGVNVIPGRVEFTLEVRDIETSVMDALAKAILSAYQTAAVDAGVTLSYQQTSDVLPAPMDPSMQRVISSVADDLGYVWRTMPSGAGHDAQHLARLCPTGMIFVPSIGGISHAPAEFTPDEDCVRGANVLLNTLARLAGPVG